MDGDAMMLGWLKPIRLQSEKATCEAGSSTEVAAFLPEVTWAWVWRAKRPFQAKGRTVPSLFPAASGVPENDRR